MKEDLSKGNKITVFLTKHAKKRIERRFNVKDLERIERVLEEAATDGLVARDGSDILIEHGCLLATCSHDDNGTLTVMTVLDLSDGISRRMKERTRNIGPAPWESAEVQLPDGWQQSEQRGIGLSCGNSFLKPNKEVFRRWNMQK